MLLPFQSSPVPPAGAAFLTGLRKICPASVKSPFCGIFALLYCNYTEGRQPLPHQLEKERHTMNESNFVVKTIFHARGSSEVLTENYFATRKEAEEFCALTDYAMKLNYGAEQQLVTTEIVAL